MAKFAIDDRVRVIAARDELSHYVTRVGTVCYLNEDLEGVWWAIVYFDQQELNRQVLGKKGQFSHWRLPVNTLIPEFEVIDG